MTRNDLELLKMIQNASKSLEIHQDDSIFFKMFRNTLRFPKITQNNPK